MTPTPPAEDNSKRIAKYYTSARHPNCKCDYVICRCWYKKQSKSSEDKCSGSTIAIHGWFYIGNLHGNSIYKCKNCSKLKQGRGQKQ